MIRRLREVSGGEFDLAEGTVYPSLHRLEAQSLLVSSWDAGGARKRRVYTLTAAGSGRLTDASASWHCFATTINAALEAGT